MSGAWSDYMSWTRAGYPAAFAAEGDPAVGKFPGNFEHYAHTVRDRMDIDDETGVFSLEVSGFLLNEDVRLMRRTAYERVLEARDRFRCRAGGLVSETHQERRQPEDGLVKHEEKGGQARVEA